MKLMFNYNAVSPVFFFMIVVLMSGVWIQSIWKSAQQRRPERLSLHNAVYTSKIKNLKPFSLFHS